MKSISLDFKNNMVCIMTDGQNGTEYNPEINKTKFYSFIQEEYRDYNSFTWNFEDETFSVNQDFTLKEGCIMTKDCFVPQFIIPMRGLKQRFDEFIDNMGYEKVNLKEEIPEDLRKLLGLE